MSDPLEELGHDPSEYVRPTQGMSIRVVRTWLIGWTFLIGLAALVLALALPDRVNHFSPGPLSAAHTGATAGDCNRCHEAASLSAGHWVNGQPSADSLLCTSCHDMGEHPLAAHGLAAGTLAASTSNRSAWVRWLQRGIPEKLACSGCHIEHEGRMHSPLQMTDAQCNNCHAEDIGSFASHPEFSDTFMQAPNPAIAFDHVSHFGTHFTDEAASLIQCSTCHAPDARGQMQVLGFEQSCASCHHHTQQIEGSLATRGEPILNIPGIHLSALTNAGYELSFWTVDRRRGGGQVAPVLSILITGAEVYPAPDFPGEEAGDWSKDEALLALLPNGTRDLREANPAQFAAVHRMAWAVRYLFAELAGQQGLEVIRDRLERVAGRPLTHLELADLAGHLPLESVRRMNDTFFSPPDTSDGEPSKPQ